MKQIGLVLAVLLSSVGCGDDTSGGPNPTPPEVARETRTRTYMEMLRANPTALEAFLLDMPKGGDLHSHTSGAIITEKLIAWGAEDGACVNPTTFIASNPCAAGSLPLSDTMKDPALYKSVLAAWSMEGNTKPLLEAHQHFFDAFGKFGAVQTDARNDDSLADVLSAAGRNNQIYVELLQGFGSSGVGPIAEGLMPAGTPWDAATLLAKRLEIIAAPAFTTALNNQISSIATAISGARQLLGCAGPKPDPGCGVEVRLLVAANRTRSRAYVFGQWVFGFELAQRVPEMVGVNLVSPEEDKNSLAYYDDEMLAMGVLDQFNKGQTGRKPVHISLHAGELIPEVLPATPDGQRHLLFHIRRAIDVAHAERIGHGVDVLGETDGDGAMALLGTAQKNGVMIEICLTSNRMLLGAAGGKHPLAAYRQRGVAVALATDDQGILRGSITKEYLAAVQDQQLDYLAIKHMARASLEHAFVEGASLWTAAGGERQVVAQCGQSPLGAASPSAECAAYLAANKRAALQWKHEGLSAAFEERNVGP